MITQEQLKELLDYSPDTGEFVWKVSLTNNVKVGRVAGTLRKDGRVQIRVNSKFYMAHRLAWLYVHGDFPKNVVDHIDGNPSNNTLINLRACTHGENLRNTRIRSNNTSGFKGVGWAAHVGKWKAYCNTNGKRKNLGYYDTEEEASAIYNKYAKEAHGEFYKDTTK